MPNDLTSISPISLRPPTASSRTWTSAFAGRGRATGAPQGTLRFSLALAKKVQVAATGTHAFVKDADEKTLHFMRLLPCPREELEEWEGLMRESGLRQQKRMLKQRQQRRKKVDRESKDGHRRLLRSLQAKEQEDQRQRAEERIAFLIAGKRCQ